jgi:hypothetical protein
MCEVPERVPCCLGQFEFEAALGDKRMDLQYLRQVNLERIYEKGKHDYKSLCIAKPERGRNVESKANRGGLTKEAPLCNVGKQGRI